MVETQPLEFIPKSDLIRVEANQVDEEVKHMTLDLNYIALLLLVIGIVLLIIEIFVPSFGILGGLGIIAIIAGIVFTAESVFQGILMFLGISAILLIVLIISWKYILKNGRSGLILRSVVNKEEIELSDLGHLINKVGTALTPLRPSGIADFDGVRLDVLTRGDFVPKGSSIQIIEIIGKKIIIKQIHLKSEN